MRIAILTPGGVDRSGSERVIPCLLWLIERLARMGHDVQLFALSQEPAPGRWPLLGATVHNAGRGQTPLALAMLVNQHRKARFDVIHAFWANGPGLVGAVAARLLGVPLVLTLAGGEMCDLPAIGYGGRRRKVDRWRLRFATGAATVVTVPSGQMQDQASALGITAVRLPLGVALDRWPVRAPAARPADRLLQLLHVGSLNRVKDQTTLLEAAARLQSRGVPFALDVIGCDTMGGAVQRQARELRLGDQVRFHGFVPHARLRPWFERADLLVVSSIHEAGPLVVLEAAAAGVATTGTNVGHLADWAPEAAVAVPIGDPDALAAAIADLAANDAKRLAIAEAAQELAVGRDADFTASECLRIYEELA